MNYTALMRLATPPDNMKPIVTLIGSLNIDLTIRVKNFPRAGETLFGHDFQTGYGGKGANQAYAVARMGGQAVMIGSVGDDDFGSTLLANMRNVGADVSHIFRRARTPSGVALITLNAEGQNHIVVATGANATLSAADVTGLADVLRASKAVVSELETSLPATTTALRIAREADVLTVLNPAPYSPIPDELLTLCDFVIPNESEASNLTGIEVRDVDTARLASQKLKAKGARNALITLGAQGVWVDSAGFVGLVPAYLVKPVDTVAAGDVFIGAFVTRLCEGADVFSAAQFGCAASAIAVTRPGAQPSIPARDDVGAFM